MGACSSNLTEAEKERLMKSRRLERELNKAAQHDEQKVKLLLLGAGESGKSTIFKQMKVIYGAEFTEAERIDNRHYIYLNVVQSIKILVNQVIEMDLLDKVKSMDNFNIVKELDDHSEINDNIGDSIKEVWLDPAIQEVWNHRTEFQIVESVRYYFDKLDEIKQTNYIPTKDDILFTRVKTSGIVTEQYDIDSTPFEMYDVGGQKNERRKWINCFDNVTAVIFVAALSEYDQTLYEDSKTNRMVDALNLFEEICLLECFRNSSVILFLNKRDLFEMKIKNKHIKDSAPFANFQGPKGDYNAGVKYFVKLFSEKNKKFPDRKLYHHVTCATDTANVQVCFNLCKQIILEDMLECAF